MAGGWAKDDSVQEQIDASLNDEVNRLRATMPRGTSLETCEACDLPIPEARRVALPGVRLCVACQSVRDEAETTDNPYNRRGNKDSQLR